MFHIYENKNRITSNPISYNHLVNYYFRSHDFNYTQVSTMGLGSAYSYGSFIIVRII